MYLQLGIPSRCICFHCSFSLSLSSSSFYFLLSRSSSFSKQKFLLSLSFMLSNHPMYPTIYALISDAVEVKGSSLM